MTYREYNFDGLVGPTHNYAGLGSGNLASMASKHHVSSPRAAAIEGLAKMKLLAELGVPQAILPPQRRPHVGYLRSKYAGGDDGSPATAMEVSRLLRAAAENGEEGRRDLAVAGSASAMWAANAATVSPSPDTADGRCHFTVANLVSQPHRSLEAGERLRVLRHVLGDERFFRVHDPLPAELPDEGAANHTRLCARHGSPGLEIFNYGCTDYDNLTGRRFVPRQLEGAAERLASMHGVGVPAAFLLIRQAVDAIEAGVFHNDVIAVGNETLLVLHEQAWDPTQRWPDIVGNLFPITVGDGLRCVWFSCKELPLSDAVRSYLFNSQLVTLPSGGMALVYPAECDEVPSAKGAIDRILREDNPVEQAVRVDVRQSMKNGGGPACLRLRVVLSDEQRVAVRGNVFWTPTLHQTLVDWVNRHYRDTLTPADLADVRVWHESQDALDDLAGIMRLPI